MELALLLAAFVMGICVGALGRQLLSKTPNAQQSQKQVEQATLELNQYRQEVSDQFVEHNQLLAGLSEQINKLNIHWDQAAKQLDLEAEAEIKPLAQLTTQGISPQEPTQPA
ncbi:ZapG family protein [Shewanella sp. NIFS-20-20]|uniref:ZapG family protein n=1 Tax=Shewanella sp. NIFS-20-20 TaxID=2853806 RepID=UPI001C4910B4|nr:DUF1043 family protein [Shewanella sp. NIFS-20-20]MBV7316170.1 YhcB family protein [Shewanella sp. NIFS-20-20]